MAIAENYSMDGTRWAHEEDLVRCAAAGDHAAFGDLVRTHQDRVFRYALGLAGNSDDAADMAQEVFIRAYRQLPSLRDHVTFTAWLTRVMVTTCCYLLKRAGRRPVPFSALGDGDGDVENLISQPLPTESVEGRVLTEERKHALVRALHRLPGDQRSLILLCSVDDVRLDEVAAAHRVPIGTVKSRLYRARERLRRFVEQEEQGKSTARVTK